MRIVRKLLDPSRPDAERLKRSEKQSILLMMHAVTTLSELQDDLKDRLRMVENGAERIQKIANESDELLNDIRVTVPENQRLNIENTADDYVMRLTPAATPGVTNVVMGKEEFKELVDFARTKCRDCADDDEECEKCRLYRLLTSVLPLDDYHLMNLCPYNLGEWVN